MKRKIKLVWCNQLREILNLPIEDKFKLRKIRLLINSEERRINQLFTGDVA